MSQDTRTERVLNYVRPQMWMYFIIPGLLGVVLLLYLFFFAGAAATTGVKGQGEGRDSQGENHLAAARTALLKQADLTTCRNVVGLLNSHLQQGTGVAVPATPKADVDRLAPLLGLAADDVEELTRPTFSPLDAHHLEACFLFRDAARTLELAPVVENGKAIRQEPLDRARLGFDWVVRQIRLQAPVMSLSAAPPAQVLRRGHGVEIERALAFLALLEQFGLDEDVSTSLQGCLLFCPNEKNEPRLWACGVVVGDKPEAMYLFDPRMGMHVPGPGGKGVATLAQAQTDANVLKNLPVDKLAYDVTPEQAKRATALVVCPLSACSSRMLFLQDRLLRDKTFQDLRLPSQVRVRLAEKPDAALAQIRDAVVKGGGKPDAVRFAPDAAVLLRRFLPKEEGGNDPGHPITLRALRGFTTDDDPGEFRLPRQEIFRLESVPWQDYPKPFRNPTNYGYQLRMGQRLRSVFMAPFVSPQIDPKSPRELTLRGQFLTAVPELVQEQEKWQQYKRRLAESRDKLSEELDRWERTALEVYANLARAKGTPDEPAAAKQEMNLWRWRQGDAMEVFMSGHIAGPYSAYLTYQLALARHEQALRYQYRAEFAKAGKTWSASEGYWKEFIDNHADRPGLAEARRYRAEALMELGRKEEAKKGMEDVSAPMTGLEKLAAAYRAREMGK